MMPISFLSPSTEFLISYLFFFNTSILILKKKKNKKHSFTCSVTLQLARPHAVQTPRLPTVCVLVFHHLSSIFAIGSDLLAGVKQ